MEIVNTRNDNIFFEGNNVRAKLLGYVVDDTNVYVYYYAQNNIYIEERVSKKFSDSIVSPDELIWIDNERLWDYLFKLGLKHKIIGGPNDIRQ